MNGDRLIMQAAVTREKHPFLFAWWQKAQGDRAAMVRIGTEMAVRLEGQIVDIKDSMDRNEALLREIKAYLEGE